MERQCAKKHTHIKRKSLNSRYVSLRLRLPYSFKKDFDRKIWMLFDTQP